MIGGDDKGAIERAHEVLEALGKRLVPTGPLGSGHAMKALNNFCGAAAYATTAEALAIGQTFGLTGEVMLDVLNTSTGRSFNSETVFKEEVVGGRYASNFALALLAKDVSIAASLAKASGLETPVCELVSARWERRPTRCREAPTTLKPTRPGGTWCSRARRADLTPAHARITEMTGSTVVTKQERVYQAIRERILSGAYGPGYRVVIDALAEEFEVSGLPVREAIRRLEAEGLVIYRPNAGAQVAPADPALFDEEMTVLAVLEGYATALAAPAWMRRRSPGFGRSTTR